MKIAKDIAEATFGRMMENGGSCYVSGMATFDKEEIESIIAAKLEPVLLEFQTINRLDKTPDYEYGGAAPNGDLPPAGDRWITPREKAVAMLTLF